MGLFRGLSLREPAVQNFWSMKAVLRCFELASGLKVNFSKNII